MKYSLSSRQTAEYLEKADEICVQWRDRNIIPDLFDKYPKANVVLKRYYSDCENPVNWEDIRMYNILGQGRFILGLSLMDEINLAKEHGYRFFYLAPVRTFQELTELKKLGVCYVELGAPLFFQMDKVRAHGVPVRAVANSAHHDSFFKHTDGVNGLWIRPEDVEQYDPYVSVIEFVGNQKQEQALFRIYAEQHKWSGDINMIIQDMNYPATNRMIPPELATSRLNCGQRCIENGRCHICYRLFDLANPELIRGYLAAMENT